MEKESMQVRRRAVAAALEAEGLAERDDLLGVGIAYAGASVPAHPAGRDRT